MKIKLILLLLISISINSEPINLTKIDTYFDIKEAKVYIDDSNQKTIDQIISEVDESEFKSYNNLNFGLSKSTFWVKLNLLSESNLKDHYIEINHPVLDYIELFYPNTEGYYQSIISGDQLPFYDREYIYRTFIFNLPIYMIQKEHSFYLKVKSSSTISIPIKIWQEKALIEKNSFEQFILGIYYGLIFVMAIYNLFLFIFVKDFSYLYYVGYIISFGLLQMSLNGLAFQYLWPNSTWLASYAPTFLIPQFAVFVIQFSRYFINSKEKTPKLDILLKYLLFFGVGLILTAMIFDISSILKVIMLYALVTIPLTVGTAIKVLRKGYKPALYYLIAWSAFFIGSGLFLLKSAGLIPNNFITSFGLQIGGALEVILLSVALAAKINLMKKEKEEAQKYAIEMQTLLANSYARFVPKQFLSNLGKNSILEVKLGDQVEKDMTIMFSDIRSFTELSERMTPEQNFNFINSYLSRMSPIIQKNHGYIDKFMGDGIMALFQGSPDDAVNSAIQMQKYVVVYNLHRKSQGYLPISIGIGLHTGKLMLGAIGGEERLEGTVISDSVNLSSRIEGLTKAYAVKIAISEKTFFALKNMNSFNCRFLDRVQVKGKKEPITVYEVMDGDDDETLELKLKTKSIYAKGIDFYYSRSFKESALCFEEIMKINPNDKVSKIYLDRSEHYNLVGESEWQDTIILNEK